jgi:hypothetical protein
VRSESPAERSLRARAAAYTKWAYVADRTAATEVARRASHDRFHRLVDPDGVLPPEERAKRAESARRAFYADMARKSAAARRRRRTA